MAAEKTIQDAVEDELEQYGVWVKVEPTEIPVVESGTEYDLEDLKNIESEGETLLTEEEESLLGSLEEPLSEVDENLSFPVEESLELPPLDKESSMEAGENMDQFNDIEAFEQDLHESFAANEEPSLKGTVSSDVLLKIEEELSSIKSELSALKKELSSLHPRPAKTTGETEAEIAGKAGFFEEDEDETIALTGDELDNILNTADITEESGQATESPEEMSGEETAVQPEAEISEPETPEEGIEIADLEKKLPGEEPITVAPEEEFPELSLEPSVPVEEEPTFEIPGEEANEALLGEKEDIIPIGEAETQEEEAEVGELEIGSEETQPVEISEESLGEFDLDIPEAEIEEPLEEIEIDIPEETVLEAPETVLEEAPLGEEAKEIEVPETIEPVLETPESETEKATTTGTAQKVSDEEELEIFDEDLNIDLEDIDLSEIESEESLSTEEFPEIEELSVEEIETAAGNEMNVEPSESVEPLELIPEETEIPEPEPVAVTVKESGEIGLGEEAGEEIPAPLKDELRSVLSYMDQLLDALPEEKIQEFAKSEHFEVYKRLFEELGLH
ncbi:MAG TPA: hypothetical protein PLG43_01620 [Spirochaetia bacterium]|nr:hypothetical protein [Spirochaetia bacterium]